ncbi:hypothetical protein [Aquihabitans sp. McL0605]|uniref:hypothetical protein n=1 Tax=Aquihabitans sp. McL0605 TaxID=3415671 RepID=UPI003CFB570D
MTVPTAPTAPSGPVRRGGGGDIPRKTLVLSVLVLFGALVLGIGAIALFSDPGNTKAPTATQDGTPHIIDRPNSGTAPEHPGDRGGSEQLLLLGGIMVAIAGIGVVIFRGGHKAQANRAKWKAAGETGQDGALP